MALLTLLIELGLTLAMPTSSTKLTDFFFLLLSKVLDPIRISGGG